MIFPDSLYVDLRDWILCKAGAQPSQETCVFMVLFLLGYFMLMCAIWNMTERQCKFVFGTLMLRLVANVFVDLIANQGETWNLPAEEIIPALFPARFLMAITSVYCALIAVVSCCTAHDVDSNLFVIVFWSITVASMPWVLVYTEFSPEYVRIGCLGGLNNAQKEL